MKSPEKSALGNYCQFITSFKLSPTGSRFVGFKFLVVVVFGGFCGGEGYELAAGWN